MIIYCAMFSLKFCFGQNGVYNLLFDFVNMLNFTDEEFYNVKNLAQNGKGDIFSLFLLRRTDILVQNELRRLVEFQLHHQNRWLNGPCQILVLKRSAKLNQELVFLDNKEICCICLNLKHIKPGNCPLRCIWLPISICLH